MAIICSCATCLREADDWLVKPLESQKDIPLSGRTLHVRQEIYRPVIDDGDYGMDVCYRFVVGHLVDGYYQIDRRFLGIEYDLFMQRSLKFRRPMFVAETKSRSSEALTITVSAPSTSAENILMRYLRKSSRKCFASSPTARAEEIRQGTGQ